MDGYSNKVDMSLDEIIKLNKKEKKQAMKVSSGGGGGGRGKGRGGGNRRGQGRGNFAGRGRGRGRGGLKQNSSGAQNVISNKQIHNMQGVKVQRTALRGGRGGGLRGRGRGRGRGLVLNQNAAVSPLNRNATGIKTVRGKGRGRGQRVFTNSNKINNNLQAQRQQRLNAVKAQATLLRKQEAALIKLQTAKKTMQDINKALKKKARDNVVNTKRGLVTNSNQAVISKPIGPGKRKLLAGLMNQNFKGSNVSLASNISGRQMVNTSVTITNQQAANKKRRRFRSPMKNSNVSIQVSNPKSQNFNKPTVQQPKSIIEQLKLLKPAVQTTYKFQKNVFSTSSTTTLSLNDRFSSSSSASISSLSNNGERKVFI